MPYKRYRLITFIEGHLDVSGGVVRKVVEAAVVDVVVAVGGVDVAVAVGGVDVGVVVDGHGGDLLPVLPGRGGAHRQLTVDLAKVQGLRENCFVCSLIFSSKK